MDGPEPARDEGGFDSARDALVDCLAMKIHKFRARGLRDDLVEHRVLHRVESVARDDVTECDVPREREVCHPRSIVAAANAAPDPYGPRLHPEERAHECLRGAKIPPFRLRAPRLDEERRGFGGGPLMGRCEL